MVVPFYAELLSNIQVLRATIETTDIIDASLFNIKNNQLYLQDDLIVDVSSLHIKLIPTSLEVIIDDETDFDNRKNNTLLWHIKINIQRDQQQQQQLANNGLSHEKQWWTSKTISQNNIQYLNCRHCLQLLLDLKPKDGKNNSLFKCKDLPSEHWYELVECWICHEAKPEEHRERMRPIFAKQGVLLVGTYYFLIHVNDFFSKDTLKLDYEMASQTNWNRGTTTKWIPVNCGKCGKVLGEGHYEQNEDKQLKLMEVKVFKYCVNLKPTIDENPNFINFVVGDMVNAANAHATRKYLIQGRKSNRIYALIWLFNWDTTIIYNDGFIDNDDDVDNENEKKVNICQSENVMKLFYVDAKHNAEAVKKWTLDKTTDHLVYPDPYCEQLINYLQKSTNILPAHLRIMNHPAMIMTNNFSIGFLPQ